MQVRLAESREQVPLGRDAWNALVARCPTSTAFQTYEWFDTWWSAFGARHKLFLLTVHDGNDIVGIAPLMRVRGPLGLRQIEFTGTPNADYQDLIVPDIRSGAIAAICAFLHDRRGLWDMIVLRNLKAQSNCVGELHREFERLGLGVMDVERQPSPTLVIRGREAEARQLLNRYSIRRALRRLDARGAVTFRTLETAAEIERYLPQFFDQHVRRWSRSRVKSPFTDETYRRWYRSLADAARQAGWLHFSILESGASPAAFHFGFSYGGVLSWYKPSFNPDFARESPGSALISRLIEDACDRGLDEFDFSSGLEPFKDRFSNVRHECLNLRVFASRWLCFCFATGSRLRNVARDCRNKWRTARFTPEPDR